jgi:nicotinamidase-related amidase
VIRGIVANICVHYTAPSAAVRWYDVVIPGDAISALDPFDVASSLRQPRSCSPAALRAAAGVRIHASGPFED